ncbi:Crp/Fnr family transcriptional regulator [Quisquiliibacterium transsilvanicum]|uniref:CRP-like cAMP-binding protein n=2 Tax=Quisquiliibacterium transsilvanicum TaxID=1549638 RepID=A0A7W8HFE0_9BURK|nr:CRP-like cAMP-binding protein [Quisquiliibacterium transsilvanicum]
MDAAQGASMPTAPDAAPGARLGVNDPRHNRLLAALPDVDWLRWRAKIEPYAMPPGQVLYESGVPLTHAYFPTSAIVSLMYVTESGASASVALVGDEGMVGVPLIMGAGSTPGRAVVHCGGAGYRISGAQLQEEFSRSTEVLRILLRYTQALIAQMAQIAVCNRHHTVDQQLCRWLLLNLDRMTGDEMAITQELIAQMLGVRREGVTEAALALQHAGLIAYRRGHITVLDREGLAQRSCECRAVIQAEYDRMLREVAPASSDD